SWLTKLMAMAGYSLGSALTFSLALNVGAVVGAIGMAAGVGRTGAILAPLLIGLLVSLKLPLEQNFIAIATAGALGAIALAFINHRASASTHHPDAVRDAMPALALREVPV